MPAPAPTIPVYDSARAQLLQGDAVELLAARCFDPEAELFDMVATDPPYNSGGIFPTGRVEDPVLKYAHNGDAKGRASFTGDCRDQRACRIWFERWMELARRCTKNSGYLLCFTDWRQLPTVTDSIQVAGWTWRGIIPWDKGRGARAPHRGFYRHQCEYVVWATNGRVPRPTDRGPFDGCIRETVKKADKHHLTGKPTAVMRQLIQAAPRGGLIADPFAGSSTTGVGALLEGRRFWGVELSADYAKTSTERLLEADRRAEAQAAAEAGQPTAAAA
jgi:site-specific DNA-methyltransferase (adenine-specific)